MAMRVSLWAEIRRLHEIQRLSKNAIARQLGCCHKTVSKALKMDEPPSQTARPARASKLDGYKAQIDQLIAQYPDLSAVRILEEIVKGDNGYRGGITIVRDYLRTIRPARGRVYHEVLYDPGEALQVDWGECQRLKIGSTSRRVSVLVAVLCYSRLCYIEFSLAEKKEDFYRCIVNALKFFGGSTRKIIFDNLKAAVISGSGKHACFHPEFLELCGHFCLQPIACARRDPESKGMVETNVRYVKQNALAGRDDELTCWKGYGDLAEYWRDQVANVRIHETTHERPVDRFKQEQPLLRALPSSRFDTDEVVAAVVSSHARVRFDSNRYSLPPKLARKTVLVRADPHQVRVLYQGQEVACHTRCFERRQLIRLDEHLLETKTLRRRQTKNAVEEEFDRLGEAAQTFRLKLLSRPVKPLVHLRRLLKLARLYGPEDVLAAIEQANEYETYDADYVEAIVHQQRRQRELPSPTEVLPVQRHWLEETDYDSPDPACYDRLLEKGDDSPDDLKNEKA
jgi:transposase